ncbi:acyl-CoA dehydrogenase [Ophiocordyceps camponoti-floridani]|uniref:Acyl-CoA dehydrogenase n=1 Tax=Ophiocordyceps camponoti-floridani TaxID=2030778 RepID=A0A8H4Q373_9HYPO|nr:acyl-CoA dehydrogenase [Ophiocordyceps camponoti-floridani]
MRVLLAPALGLFLAVCTGVRAMPRWQFHNPLWEDEQSYPQCDAAGTSCQPLASNCCFGACCPHRTTGGYICGGNCR